MTARLADRVRDRLVGSGGIPTAAEVAAAVRAESNGVVGDRAVLAASRRLQREFLGAGILEPLLRDPNTADVLVTSPTEVWVDQGRGLRRTDVRFPDEDSVRRLAGRLAVAAGRRLDHAEPYVDGWLPHCGSAATRNPGQSPGTGDAAVRLHAVIPPIAVAGTCISLRVLRPARHDLTALCRLGMIGPSTESALRSLVAARLAFLVVGGAGSGKTTLLSALLTAVSHRERIVCVEDASELHPSHPHVVRLAARPSNVEGVGEISLRVLVRQALRMRPDRLIVGEVRGAEVCELLAALNTGHDGGAGTLHANSPTEVPARLEALAALGGLPRAALHSQLAAAVHVVLHTVRDSGGQRRLTGIAVLDRSDEWVRVIPAWRQGQGTLAGWARLAALAKPRGVELPCPG